MKKDNPYDQRYAGQDYYWTRKPSSMCRRTLEFIRPRADFRPRLIDLGCGEGRNAVFFARQGFDVTGLEVSAAGIEKTCRWAREADVEVRVVQADMITYRPDATYDVVFSTGTLQYVPPEARAEWFERFKDATSPEGLHVMSVFVRKPFIAKAPDAERDAHAYTSGELMGYYWDWEILFSREEIFDCDSGGAPHRHAVNRVIARRHEVVNR